MPIPVSISLIGCPECESPAEVVPSIKRGLYIAQCSARKNCSGWWPITHLHHSEQEAAEAWNRGELLKPGDTVIDPTR